MVSERLGYAEECIEGLRALPGGSLEEFLSDPRNALSADALLRRALEAIFDTARHLLSKGFGAGGLEYKQVAEQASDRGLVGDETGRLFHRIAGFRNRLIHHYDDVLGEELFGIIQEHLGDLGSIVTELRDAAGRLAQASDGP